MKFQRQENVFLVRMPEEEGQQDITMGTEQFPLVIGKKIIDAKGKVGIELNDKVSREETGAKSGEKIKILRLEYSAHPYTKMTIRQVWIEGELRFGVDNRILNLEEFIYPCERENCDFDHEIARYLCPCYGNDNCSITLQGREISVLVLEYNPK